MTFGQWKKLWLDSLGPRVTDETTWVLNEHPDYVASRERADKAVARGDGEPLDDAMRDLAADYGICLWPECKCDELCHE
jgi:hypothetical protein